jgi:glycosyltransferase involved in cell wall biosynthesis
VLHIKGSSPFGGDCVLMLELGREARERGYEVDILATDPHFQELIRDEGLGIVDLDVIRRAIRPVWDTRGLARLTAMLRRSNYSLVHTHTSKPGVVGTLAARLARVPAVVHTVHLFPFHEESGRVAAAAYVAAERLAARWCDRLITVSDHQRDWALRLGIGQPGQVVSIPNGVPTSRVQTDRAEAGVRAELGVGPGQFLILSTGRLAEQKGLEHLIRAAAMLREELPELKIALAGSGPLERPLRELVSELGVGGIVSFLGLRSDVGDLLAAADLVVLPSLWEGLSISLLEAMAAGKAVVTTDIGANREVTNHGEVGVLVPPKDSVALAAAIRSAVADRARLVELGRRAREVQVERYTIRRMLDAYFEQYEAVLSREVHAVPASRPITGTS